MGWLEVILGSFNQELFPVQSFALCLHYVVEVASIYKTEIITLSPRMFLLKN